MRSPRRAQMLTAGVTAVMFALTGCSTNTAPLQPSTPTSSKTSAWTTSVKPTAEPVVLAPPTSASDAIVDANNSLLGYYKASFASGHAGGTRLNLVVQWTAGSALRNEQILAGYLKEKHFRLEGAPTSWTLNLGQSSAADAKKTGGGIVRYGAVRLVGCAESTNHPVGPGAPAWTSKGKRFAKVWSVLYDPKRQQWVVAAAIPDPDGRGGAKCD